MHVTVWGKPPASLPLNMRLVVRSRPKGEVEGFAYDAPAATRMYKRAAWKTYGLGYAVILFAWLISSGNIRTTGALIATAVIVALMIGLIAVFHRLDLKRWYKNVDARVAGLPPAGTRSKASPDSFTIGDNTYLWSSLKVDAVDRGEKTTRTRRWLEIDRLRLVANDGKSYTLDSTGYQNGAKLVDVASTALWPQLQPIAKS